MPLDSIWEQADASVSARLVRRLEAAWEAAPTARPDPLDFLPRDAGPAALLALLRADLALHRAAGNPLRIESYRDRIPDLPANILVALLYEEFCLREEEGESPTLAEYAARFPLAAAELREILEIHSLVRAGRRSLPATVPAPAALPETGQTIAGYQLVEELGRGAFARVFLARERPLANRLVALKVARGGSREPQALARLQHTHIVPVYSYRIDPATNLHLLCMPYLGRVTLADLLAHPLARTARGGEDLLAALDQLGPSGPGALGRPEAKRELARRGYARAIAWWGARLAEALQHAHDRGVLHRDIKPSNILISADGLPMLLDFNLAHESWVDDPDAAPSRLGGTLAYMAPEQLDALADGASDRVDGRADVYSLGLVLFEALSAGVRPFSAPQRAAPDGELLRRAARDRRLPAPRLRLVRPDVPPEIEVVVQRCLAPEPDDRYGSPAELAADLQAVADDGPLLHAPEPLPSRARRWLRRHRRGLWLTAPPLLAVVVLVSAAIEARLTRLGREVEIGQVIRDGENSLNAGRLEQAAGEFSTAIRLASDRPAFRALADRARRLRQHAVSARQVRARADTLFARAEPLRFGLLGFGGDPDSAARGVEEVLRLFGIADDPRWTARPELTLLDPDRRERLFAEADELLFLWIVALDRGRPPDEKRDARCLALCDAARVFASETGPWSAMRTRYQVRLEGLPDTTIGDALPPDASPLAYFQWALLYQLSGRSSQAIACLERAVDLRPGAYWFQFYLGYRHERAGHLLRALEHFDVAVAQQPNAPWALYNRAQLRRQQGELGEARTDADRALAAAQAAGFAFHEARLESGVIREFLGDLGGARADYDAVIAHARSTPLIRAARFNLAKIDLNAGHIDRASTALDALLSDATDDPNARFGLALLALRLKRYEHVEAEITRLLRRAVADPAELHAQRTLARLALGRTAEAVGDADTALRLRPTPAHARLWYRTLLADGRDLEMLLGLDDPEFTARLPAVDDRLPADLRSAVARLRALADRDRTLAAPALRTSAVLLSTLGDSTAVAVAARAIAAAPGAADGYLVRARIQYRAHELRGALRDVERGLALAPADPRLRALRGQMLVDLNRPELGLAELEFAALQGARGTVHAARARALVALSRFEAAEEAWTLALAHDAEDPLAYAGRAFARARLGRWDRATADLEQAAGWSGGRADVLARVALTYAVCLPRRPDRLSRTLDIARQAVRAAFALPPTRVGVVGRQ